MDGIDGCFATEIPQQALLDDPFRNPRHRLVLQACYQPARRVHWAGRLPLFRPPQQVLEPSFDPAGNTVVDGRGRGFGSERLLAIELVPVEAHRDNEDVQGKLEV